MAELARVEVRSTVLPPLSFGIDPLAPDAPRGALASLALKLLRPSVKVTHPFGVTEKAPGGDPGDLWPVGLAVVVGLLLAVVGFAAYGVRAYLRRK